MQEKHTDWLTFVAQYRDGSFDHFAVDPFTLLSDNYIACDDARERQEEGSLKLGEIVLVYRDRRLLASWRNNPILEYSAALFVRTKSKPDPLPPVEPEQRLIEQVLPTLVGDVWEALCMARHNLSGKFSHRALIRSVSTLRRIVQKMGQRAGRNESVWSDTFALNVEAQRVIRLRLAAVAQGGPSALPEIRLMVMEKIVALLHATGMLARGGSARAVLLYYRSRVQANERRLSASMNPLHRATQKLLRRVPGIAKRLA